MQTSAKKETEEDEKEEERLLVQEVLSEFPPDERGERQEWNQQVGWHRRETIRGHRYGPKGSHEEDPTAAGNRNQHATPMNGAARRERLHHPFMLNNSSSSPSVVHLLILVTAIVLAGIAMSKFLRKRRKRRTG